MRKLSVAGAALLAALLGSACSDPPAPAATAEPDARTRGGSRPCAHQD